MNENKGRLHEEDKIIDFHDYAIKAIEGLI